MNDQEKSKEQLTAENAELRRRVAELEASRTRPDNRGGPWQSNDARWRSLAAHTPVLVFVLDQDHCIRFANHTDSGAAVSQVFGKPFHAFCRPEERDSVRECLQRVFQTGQPGLYEAPVLRLDNEEHWYASHVGPIFEAGKVVAVSVIAVNVTDRRRAEAALRESEERYRSLAETTTDVIYILDEAGKLLYANRTAAAYFGVSPQALVGKTQQDLFPPERVPSHVAHIRKVFETGEMQEEEFLYRFGPHEVWLNVRTIPLRDEQGQISSAMGVCRNITKQKQAELALQESEERFRRIFDEGPLGVVLASLDARIQRVNLRFCDLLGYSEREIIALGIEGVSHPDDNRLDAQLAARLVAGEIPFYTIDKRFVRKDGQVIWGQVTVTLLRNAEGQPTHFIGMIEDITARKRTEQELRNAKERLEQRVLERTAELRESNELLHAEVEQRRQAEQALRDAEERLSFALEASGIGAWDLDLLDHTAHRSLQHARIFGYGSLTSSWTFEMFLEHVVPEDREGVHHQIRQAFDVQGDFSFECRIRRSDGEIRWIWVAGCHRLDESGQPRRRTGIIQDITDRKKAEEAIRQSEAKYRALIESCPDAVGMLDLQGRLVFASQRAAEQYGVLHHDELVGRQAMDFLVTADHDKFRTSFNRLIEEGVQRDIQYTLFRRDGTTFDAEISSAVIRDATGNPEAVTCVFRDITKRKLAEEKVKAEQQALRRMVLASDHERRLITYELHDGAAQQLMGALMLFQSPALQKAWESAETADAYRLGIEGLRRASAELRGVMGRLRTPVLDMYGLSEAIEDVASQLRLRPDAPEIECRSDVKFMRLESTLENTLFRIAQEAMTNACRHSKGKKVRVKLSQKGKDVTLEVRDWGIGFDQGKVQENRFGLEGIRERARILGGKLSVRSQLGKGTVVHAKFPVIEAMGEE